MQTIIPLDILELNDPIVSYYVRLWKMGVLSWEQAMMETVFALALQKRQEHDIQTQTSSLGQYRDYRENS